MLISGVTGADVASLRRTALYEVFANVEHHLRQFMAGIFQRVEQIRWICGKRSAFQESCDQIAVFGERQLGLLPQMPETVRRFLQNGGVGIIEEHSQRLLAPLTAV